MKCRHQVCVGKPPWLSLTFLPQWARRSVHSVYTVFSSCLLSVGGFSFHKCWKKWTPYFLEKNHYTSFLQPCNGCSFLNTHSQKRKKDRKKECKRTSNKCQNKPEVWPFISFLKVKQWLFVLNRADHILCKQGMMLCLFSLPKQRLLPKYPSHCPFHAKACANNMYKWPPNCNQTMEGLISSPGILYVQLNSATAGGISSNVENGVSLGW